MSGRKRPSGLGSNSRRFAEVRNPDGSVTKVPASKDACTYVCLEEDGGWPARAMAVLLYDATWMDEGITFPTKEMRPGYGMGTRRTVRVIETQAELEIHEGNYGQVKRWVLVEEVMSRANRMNLTAEELLNEGA